LPYFLFVHLADPQHPTPLQTATVEIDRTFVERLVEIASP
jgi:hypothetical protein